MSDAFVRRLKGQKNELDFLSEYGLFVVHIN
jgi:hypothetical protein